MFGRFQVKVLAWIETMLTEGFDGFSSLTPGKC
jgi:hypothetical protein